MTFNGLAQGVVINLFMLLGFVAFFSMARRWTATRLHLIPAWANGLLFGVMAVLSMLVPSITSPGVMFDCRSGVIGAGALLGGPVCALTSILFPCLYRLHIGGLGLIPGLLEIILPAFLGSLCYWFYQSRQQALTLPRAILQSLFVGTCSNVLIVGSILVFMQQQGLLLETGSLVLIILNGPLSMALFTSLLVLERQHAESMELHSSILQTAMEGYWLIDKQGRLLEVNAAYCRMSGFSESELLTKSIADLEAATTGPDVAKRFQDIAAKGWERFEAVHRRKDGRSFSVEVSAQYLPDKSGRFVSFLRDITDRKKTEAALQESEKKYKQLIEATNTGFVILDEKGRVLDANPEYVRMTGNGSLEDIRGRPVTDWTAAYDLERNAMEVRKCLRTGSVRNLEIDYIDAKGRVLPVEIHATMLPGGESARIMTICRDITKRRLAVEEKKSLQEQLFKAQKMESIGAFAGGIAHDFNNILQPIVGICEMLMHDLSGNKHLQDKVQIALNNSLRAADLVKQILALGRQTKSNKQQVKIQKTIHEILDLIRHTLPSTISVTLKIDESADSIMADPGQIHQMLMNLITNAYHAMEDSGGALEIGLSEIRIGTDNPPEPTLAPGRYLDLYVSDTGIGMEESIIARIFDPFFTTKDVGKGTGLGLSVSFGIIREHGGAIKVLSKPGEGSIFHVYLPVKDLVFTGKNPISAAPVRGGAERILFVDDESCIVDTVAPTLELLGYTVTAKANSVDALEAFRNDPGRFDILITDMTMPNMTGVQLAGEIHRICPGFPIILCTGFSEQINEEQVKALGIKAFMMKPIVRDPLAAIVRKVLDSRD